MIRPKQCKDIPDKPILEFLAKNPERWHNWSAGNQWDVSQAMPEDTPDRLILAKMRRLIQRGVVDGCACGCRGDFVITDKGLAMIDESAPEP